MHKLEVLEGFDEEEIWTGEVSTKHFVDRFAHVRIKVHWIDEINICVLLGEVLHGSHHTDKAAAKVLTTVTGNENKLLTI